MHPKSCNNPLNGFLAVQIITLYFAQNKPYLIIL
jgi:hypothetical protein